MATRYMAGTMMLMASYHFILSVAITITKSTLGVDGAV